MTIPEVDDGPLLVHRRGRVVEHRALRERVDELGDVGVARVAPEKAHAFFSERDHEHAAGHACENPKENGVTKIKK